jgi:hypothetical protein
MNVRRSNPGAVLEQQKGGENTSFLSSRVTCRNFFLTGGTTFTAGSRQLILPIQSSILYVRLRGGDPLRPFVGDIVGSKMVKIHATVTLWHHK